MHSVHVLPIAFIRTLVVDVPTDFSGDALVFVISAKIAVIRIAKSHTFTATNEV